MIPIDIIVKLKNGKTRNFNIPLEIMRGTKGNDWYKELTTLPDWQWTNPYYTFQVDLKLDEIESIVIDPSTRLADINMSNNVYPSKPIDEKESKANRKTKKELKSELKAIQKEMKQKIKAAPKK